MHINPDREPSSWLRSTDDPWDDWRRLCQYFVELTEALRLRKEQIHLGYRNKNNDAPQVGIGRRRVPRRIKHGEKMNDV